jgi:hypothetical protein
VDERQILLTSAYSAGVSGVYGAGSGAITGIAVSALTDVTVDESIRLTAAGTSFNYATNNFDTINVDAQGANATIVTTAANAALTTISVTGVGLNAGAEYQLDVNYADLKYLATAAAADGTEIDGTETLTGTATRSTPPPYRRPVSSRTRSPRSTSPLPARPARRSCRCPTGSAERRWQA